MTTRWGLGYRMGDGHTRLQTTSIRLGLVRLLRRAPHLRCGARLFVPLAGPWWLGRAACRSLEVRRAGWLVRERPPMSLRAGTFDAVGDGNPVPERVGCPRLERIAPGRSECPRRHRRHSRPWSPRKLAIGTSPAGPQWGGAREPGWKTWDVSGAHPRKILTSDKPDLFLVHLRSVQGSGILRGNRSTSYSRRRIPDHSGRPSVAFHQSNRQGCARAPSSGQVRDDVPRGDQGASGR